MIVNPSHVTWCRQMFDGLKDNGIWGFPSAGFIFRKRGSAFVLTDRMPHHPDMPMNKGAWTKHQHEWLASTIIHFNAAGIEVIIEA